MSDVDTTKREIDEHEQKGEPHHTRYSDSEARTAVDGANVSIAGDAETVDGKHAADLGEPNVPDWEEDANSPISASGVSSETFTLAGTYDHVKLVIEEVTNVSGSDDRPYLRLNGDTNSNYEFVEVDGTTTTGDTNVPLVFGYVNDGESIHGEIYISGRWQTNPSIDMSVTAETAGELANKVEGAINVNTVSPLDSVTFTTRFGYSFDYKIRVYGLDT